jgi:hypothetical protein
MIPPIDLILIQAGKAKSIAIARKTILKFAKLGREMLHVKCGKYI